MIVVLSGTTLAAGTAAGEPCRLVGGAGERAVQVQPGIRSAAPGIFDRKNVSFTDSIEVEYLYTTASLACSGFAAKRAAALALAKGTLTYNGNTVSTGAIVRSATLVNWTVCSIVVRYDIIGV
jgi:hypothetical protein